MPADGGGGARFETVTVTPADVVRVPPASRAIAVNVCVPSVAVKVFQAVAYGALVTSVPRLVPSSWNCTPAIPLEPDAVADTVVVPDTVVPAVGIVMDAVGADDPAGPGHRSLRICTAAKYQKSPVSTAP